MRTRAIAAAMMLACITTAEGHAWYPHNCCHDNDCKPVPCGELVEMRYGGAPSLYQGLEPLLAATRQPVYWLIVPPLAGAKPKPSSIQLG
jgi:hypothetical protein